MGQGAQDRPYYKGCAAALSTCAGGAAFFVPRPKKLLDKPCELC